MSGGFARPALRIDFIERADGNGQFPMDLGRNVLDLALIAVGWIFFIAVMLYPVLQIVGLLVAAFFLLRSGDERDWTTRNRVLKLSPVKVGC